MEFLREMTRFIMSRKKYWLVPALVVLLMVGTILFVTSGSAIAPFIYTLF